MNGNPIFFVITGHKNSNVKYALTIEWGEWRCLRGWLW